VEDDPVGRTREVEGGVVPGGEVARPAELVALVARRGLPHVVGEKDRRPELALDRAELAEDCRDLAGVVLVDASEPDERVEHDENGTVPGDGRMQALDMIALVEAELGHVEEEERGGLEVEATSAGDRSEASAE